MELEWPKCYVTDITLRTDEWMNGRMDMDGRMDERTYGQKDLSVELLF